MVVETAYFSLYMKPFSVGYFFYINKCFFLNFPIIVLLVVGECKQRYYPHPSDCQKYLDCPYGNNVLTCPNNKMWNQQRQYCDWAYNVKCKKGK